MANSEDPDEMLHKAAFHQGLKFALLVKIKTIFGDKKHHFIEILNGNLLDYKIHNNLLYQYEGLKIMGYGKTVMYNMYRLRVRRITVKLYFAGNHNMYKPKMSRGLRFPTMRYVRPAKPQISLGIHAV